MLTIRPAVVTRNTRFPLPLSVPSLADSPLGSCRWMLCPVVVFATTAAPPFNPATTYNTHWPSLLSPLTRAAVFGDGCEERIVSFPVRRFLATRRCCWFAEESLRTRLYISTCALSLKAAMPLVSGSVRGENGPCRQAPGPDVPGMTEVPSEAVPGRNL